MSLTAADVSEIMRLVEQSGFDELILEMNGVKLHLRRGAAAAIETAGTPPIAPPPASTPAPAASHRTQSTPEPGISVIESPMLGTFYRAPKPGSDPFVDVGSVVEEDTVIAIIEVMKLMNSVRAGVRGTVTEIHPADGTLVEYGDVLMKVRTSP